MEEYKKVVKKQKNYYEQRGMKNLNCLMDLVLYQTFRAISNTSSKSMEH